MITVSPPRMPSMPTVILDGESISSSVLGMGGLGRLSFFFFGRSLSLATGGFFTEASCSTAPLSGSESVAMGALGYPECRSYATDPEPDRPDGMNRILAIALTLAVFSVACAGTAPLPPKALALNEAGDVAQPHHALGVLAERERRPDLASPNYYEALRVDPGFAPSRANLAHLLYNGGLYEEALIQFRRLVEVAPDVIDAHVGLAATLLHLERVSEARTVIENALAAAPEDPELAILAARLEIRGGEYNAAIARLSPLTHARSDLAVHALAWLAAAEVARGRPREAVAAAERAIALAPDDALASYALGVGLKKLGDPAADRWLERASALSRACE